MAVETSAPDEYRLVCLLDGYDEMIRGGPRSASAHLFVSGYCPPDLAAQGPVRLAVTLAGRPVPPAQIPEGGRPFALQFPVPADLAGQPELEVGLTLTRTFRPTGEDRDLGLSFGVFEVK